MKKYFMNRKQWGIETEKMIRKAIKDQQEYWARIIEQKILQAKDKITIEKNLEIRELEGQIRELKDMLKELRKDHVKVEKLKNELLSAHSGMNYQKKCLEEVQTAIGIRIGRMDYQLDQAEKVVKKQ